MGNLKRSKDTAWAAAKRYGIDTTLLELNLKKSPTERVIALQNAISFANLLIKSGTEYYARLRKTHKTAVR